MHGNRARAGGAAPSERRPALHTPGPAPTREIVPLPPLLRSGAFGCTVTALMNPADSRCHHWEAQAPASAPPSAIAARGSISARCARQAARETRFSRRPAARPPAAGFREVTLNQNEIESGSAGLASSSSS